jgi:hypothetical protein
MFGNLRLCTHLGDMDNHERSNEIALEYAYGA